MTSLVSPADVRVLLSTSLSDANLQVVIDRVEDEITSRIGSPQDDNGAVTHAVTKPGEGGLLFVPTEISSVVSIVEDDTTLDADQYQIWAGGVIERLPEGSVWGKRNVVTYKPADDRQRRKAAIIDLIRLDIERRAMQSENIAGEYSYTAPKDWEAERMKIIRRLTFMAV